MEKTPIGNPSLEKPMPRGVMLRKPNAQKEELHQVPEESVLKTLKKRGRKKIQRDEPPQKEPSRGRGRPPKQAQPAQPSIEESFESRFQTCIDVGDGACGGADVGCFIHCGSQDEKKAKEVQQDIVKFTKKVTKIEEEIGKIKKRRIAFDEREKLLKCKMTKIMSKIKQRGIPLYFFKSLKEAQNDDGVAEQEFLEQRAIENLAELFRNSK